MDIKILKIHWIHLIKNNMDNNKKQREDIIKKWKDSGLLDNLEYDDIINPTFKKGFKVHGSILTQEDNKKK
jgi:hypothetical protein